MKTQQFLQSMTELLTRWWRWYKDLRRKKCLFEARTALSNLFLYLLKTSRKIAHLESERISSIRVEKTKSGISAKRLNSLSYRAPVVFAIAIVSLTGVMGHNLYNQPQLKVGTTAQQTIKAPYSARIEDKKKTEAQRKVASKSFVPVLMVDVLKNQDINYNLQQLLIESNNIRSSAGSFPFFDPFVVSLSTQRYLRSCSNSEWLALLLAIQNSSKQKSTIATQKPGSRITALKNLDSKLVENNQHASFAQAVAELEAYRLKNSQQNLSALIAKISQARQAYAEASAKLLEFETVNTEIVYEPTSLLDLSDQDWAKTQVGIRQITVRILTQGIPPGLPPAILQDAVSLQVQTLIPKDAETLATRFLLAVLKPNLKQDEVQTQLQAAQASAEVKPVIVSVNQGEVIVKQGKKITPWDIKVLEHYRLIRREIHWLELIHLGGTVTVAVGIFALVEWRMKSRLRQRDHLLVLLLTLSTPFVVTMGMQYTTWSGIGLLLGSLYGPTLGVTVVGLLVVLLPISLPISWTALLAGASGGILGCCLAQRLRSREELALLSVAIAVTEAVVYLLVKLLIGAAFGPASYVILREAALFALSGLAWSIIALGLSPYLEKLFDLVTPIRLAELANPNRPLLKRIATETPGTFQHTLFVATLAEAAAKQLKCNLELVRAGTLYHDIGKMHDPLAFIENQMAGVNKHDTEINDPWKSAAIIKKHVSQGLVMAHKHSLPSAIQAFIPEHQGTMLIAYFHHQAQQMAQEDPSLTVNEADFRYDGPIPQSRETGIVMLADSCEAALRSLKDATPEQALAMINNILRARWQDNQLIYSGLTREEMTEIAEIFVQVWQQFHHKRIAYPKIKTSN